MELCLILRVHYEVVKFLNVIILKRLGQPLIAVYISHLSRYEQLSLLFSQDLHPMRLRPHNSDKVRRLECNKGLNHRIHIQPQYVTS